MTGPAPHHVVIIGGGFGGLSAARRLADTPVRVTLLDTTGVHVFQPLLYQVATGVLSEGQISSPLRSVLRRHRNISCLTATVTDVDVPARQVTAQAPGGRQIELSYDSLIVAAGVEPSYFGHDELAQHSTSMKTLADALELRRRVYSAFETAESQSDPAERSAWLTFALVGAGPTGVELAGQLREVALHTLRAEFRRIDPAEARVVLLDAGERAVSSFSPAMSETAERTLRHLGVELELGMKVTSIDADGIRAQAHDGSELSIPTRTVLWTAGVAAGSLAATVRASAGVPDAHGGRLPVEPDLTLAGHPEVFAIGDIASLDHLPGVAEVAMQGGRHAASQILERLQTGHTRAGTRFRYRNLGSAAYVSRGHALVEAGPLRLSGRLGWFGWGVVHLAFLTGYRNRAAAVLSWLTTLATGTRRERTFTSPHES